MIFRLWSFFKLIYLYLSYWLVGLEEEEFYIPKANYCSDIGWYNTAIENYKKALNESKDPAIHSALGWCYAETGNTEKSVEHYRMAFRRKGSPEIALGLAYAEYNVGNISEFKKLCHYLEDHKPDYRSELKDQLKKLKELLKNVRESTDEKLTA